MWAKNVGLKKHPEWYPAGLTENSSIAEFQAFLGQRELGGCLPACGACQTAVPGDACYEVVEWAMYNGIKAYPALFPGLVPGSPAEEFQLAVHNDNRIAYKKDPPISAPEDCRAYMSIEGCAWTSQQSCPGQPLGKNGTVQNDGSLAYQCCCEKELWKPVCTQPCMVCRTAVPGDECYNDVMWAMSIGIHVHPEWYPNLTDVSTFEEFQELLSARKPCPRPCERCRTLKPGDKCFEGVMWAKQHGIQDHPDWYPELSPHSSFNAFQAHLHQAGVEGCPLPCMVILDPETFDF